MGYAPPVIDGMSFFMGDPVDNDPNTSDDAPTIEMAATDSTAAAPALTLDHDATREIAIPRAAMGPAAAVSGAAAAATSAGSFSEAGAEEAAADLDASTLETAQPVLGLSLLPSETPTAAAAVGDFDWPTRRVKAPVLDPSLAESEGWSDLQSSDPHRPSISGGGAPVPLLPSPPADERRSSGLARPALQPMLPALQPRQQRVPQAVAQPEQQQGAHTQPTTAAESPSRWAAGSFSILKPLRSSPLVAPASWLPPRAQSASPQPASGERLAASTPAPAPAPGMLPPPSSNRFSLPISNAVKSLSTEAAGPATRPPKPPLSRFVIQNLSAALALVVVCVLLPLLTNDDGYTSKFYRLEDRARLSAIWKTAGIGRWGGAANTEINAAVAAVGQHIVAAMASSLHDRTVRFLVVNERDVPQAFALPDDTVVVTIGMLWRLRNEAQLAALLAHTISHQTLGHGDFALDHASDSPQSVIAVLDAFAANTVGSAKTLPAVNAAVAVEVAEAAASVVNEPKQEDAADALTLAALEAAGYSRLALREVLVDVLAPVRRQHSNWIAFHPDLSSRLNTLDVNNEGRTGEHEYAQLLIKLKQPRTTTTASAIDIAKAKARATAASAATLKTARPSDPLDRTPKNRSRSAKSSRQR